MLTSSLSNQITSYNSARHFPQFFLHNDVNNLTQIDNQADHGVNQDYIFTTMPITTTMRSTTANPATSIQVNPSSYVTRIITSNNINSNDNKSKKLLSSSASYFHPNVDQLYSSSDFYKRTPSNGTVLPVYYQNETTGQTCPINQSLPTIKNISVNTVSNKPSITIKPTNLLPNLNSNSSSNGVVTITNANGNSNGIKTYTPIRSQVNSLHNSYSNLADNSNEYTKIIKTVNIPNYFNNSNNNTNVTPDYSKTNNKYYS